MARYREQEAELAASCAALASPAAAVAPAAAADIAMDVVIEPPSPRVRKM
jgi:hypothetical protein